MSDPEDESRGQSSNSGNTPVSSANPDTPGNLRAPSFPLLSAERVGSHEPGLAPPHHQPIAAEDEPGNEPSRGPNLALIYGLVALALVAAIGFAILIVLPFYLRR